MTFQTFESNSDAERKVVEEFLRDANRFIIHEAKITGNGPLDGQYFIDVYAGGYDAPVSHQHIVAFATFIRDEPFLSTDGRVRVILREDSTAFIVQRGVPYGSGKYKVLMIVDFENPGSIDWDYPRFW